MQRGDELPYLECIQENVPGSSIRLSHLVPFVKVDYESFAKVPVYSLEPLFPVLPLLPLLSLCTKCCRARHTSRRKASRKCTVQHLPCRTGTGQLPKAKNVFLF